jgi:uncharacterized protein YkwD
MQKRSLVTSLVLAVLLSACGGGGGSDSPSAPPAPPSTPPTTPPAPAPAPAPATVAATRDVLPATYQNTAEASMYQAINALRRDSVMTTLRQTNYLDAAAANMALYSVVNYTANGIFDNAALQRIDPASGNIQMAHVQEVGRTHFTGVYPFSRALAAGMPVNVTVWENAGFYYSNYQGEQVSNWCIDGWLRSKFHRQALLDPRVNLMGLGTAIGRDVNVANSSPGTCYFTAVNVGLPVAYDSDWSSVYPLSASTVPLVSDFDGKGLAPSVSVNGAIGTVNNFFMVNVATGQTVPGTVAYSSIDSRVYSNIAFFVPNAPLAENTTYEVTFNGTTSTGVAIQRRWSFSTGVDRYKN